MRIFFVRHGESEANVRDVFSNRGWKHPLTPAGLEQARWLGERLANRGVAAVYTSPIRRAVETARIVATGLKVPHLTEPALAEYDVGDYEDRGGAEGRRLQAEIERRWDAGDFDAHMPGGESCNDIRARFPPFITRVIEQAAARDAALVMVSHGGTLRYALPMILTNVSPEFAVDHRLTYTATVEAELHDGALRCVRWGDEPMA